AAQRVTVLDQLARALSPVAAAFVADDLSSRRAAQPCAPPSKPVPDAVSRHGRRAGNSGLSPAAPARTAHGRRARGSSDRTRARRRWRRLPCRRPRAVVEGEALLGLERQRRVAEPCQRGMTVERL